ncbi:gamma-aminobutyric acid receptor subunit beta-like [Oppia nitens]|uniref:gamma-aminobutyric acid receptor subunit beta-like n=1 Tax=Oppia nitens TaxID=1686743 RepID=UPI0023DB4129|nr:gamma-aminobutyric acid receptor subunit beta-like [Oppia nitens]
MSNKIISIFLLICCIQQIFSENDAIRAVIEFKAKSNPNLYDKDINPKLGHNSSVNVGITLYIINYKINPKDKSVTTNMYFRQSWSDPRLRHSYPDIKVVGSQSFVDRIWTPDTFISNADSVSSVSVPKPTAFARIDSNGTVLISHKLKLMTRCSMDNSSLVCPIEIESYGHSMNDIDYDWGIGSQGSGISTNNIWAIDGYKLNTNSTDYVRKVENLSTGNYTGLVMTMKFERDTI